MSLPSLRRRAIVQAIADHAVVRPTEEEIAAFFAALPVTDSPALGRARAYAAASPLSVQRSVFDAGRSFELARLDALVLAVVRAAAGRPGGST